MAERVLVARARSGDAAAFGELVTRHMQRGYYAALGLVGSHEDALDLSQEAFVRAFRARTSLDPDRAFYPWLYQILRRLCFNFVRDRRTRREKLERAGHWLMEEAVARSSASSPERTAERAELRSRLEVAIEALPVGQREVLALKQFQGLKYREIAELLDIPIGTVMSRLYTARKSLAENLGDLQ
jgi:RNA polymerase sigma-70 factor (ECF subfamily)